MVVINTEWGGFGSGMLGVLPMTSVDLEIDACSPNPGQQWFEKLIAGYYLGEITRRLLEKLAGSGELWTGCKRSQQTTSVFSFESRHASSVECDESDDLRQVRDIEATVLGVTGSTLADRRTVQTVCRLVTERCVFFARCAERL